MSDRRFPIQGGPSIPWAMIAPYESVAQDNHSQSLERLAERAGLSPYEAVLVLECRKFSYADLPAQSGESQEVFERKYLTLLEEKREAFEGALITGKRLGLEAAARECDTAERERREYAQSLDPERTLGVIAAAVNHEASAQAGALALAIRALIDPEALAEDKSPSGDAPENVAGDAPNRDAPTVLIDDVACVETKTCSKFGCKSATLVPRGGFYCCPACGSSYGNQPHPELENLAGDADGEET